MQPEKTGKSLLFERVASKRLRPLKKGGDGCEAVGGGIWPALSSDRNAVIGIVSAACATLRALHRSHASAIVALQPMAAVARAGTSMRCARGEPCHADRYRTKP